MDEAAIAAGAEAQRRMQEARDEREKTKQFEEMRKKNEAAIKEQQEYQDKLTKAKTAPERIKLRQESEDRLRRENIRVSRVNRGEKEPNMFEKQMITQANLKRKGEEIASKAPGFASKVVTGLFSPVVETTTHSYKAPGKNPAVSGLVRESGQFGKAVSGHAKRPVTGGKVANTQVGYNLAPNESFTDMLLGKHVEVTTGRKPVKSGGKLDPMSGLDNFVKRL